MLLLHTADWHLGRTTRNYSRREDHEAVLREIVAIAREEQPDLIVHAGDLFDAVRPPYEEISLALDTLHDLAAVAPTVVICGNHDSPALFRIFQKLLGAGSRLRFVDRARPPAAGGILDFPVGRQRLRLAPLPFVHQNRLIDAFEDPAQRTVAYADRIAVIEQRLGEGLLDGYDGTRDVLLFAAHLHTAGARLSHSERELHISEGYATRPEHVPVVSYAAFGHIHCPQSLTGTTTGRYAGSPIQLDFGEVSDTKEVVLVELEPGQPARVREIALKSGRRLRHFVGTLSQLEVAASSIGREICLVTLDVPEPVPDLSDRVAALLPDAVVVHVNEIVANRRLVPAEDLDTGGHEPTLVEHFRGYLDAQGTRAAAADRVLEGFSRFYDALAAEEEPSFPEERLLLDDVEPADAEGDTTGACIDAASPDGDRPVVPVQMQLAGMEPSEPGSSTPPRRRR